VKVEILEDESRKHAIENSDKKVTKVESAKVQKIKKVNIKDSSVSSNLINNWEEIEVKKTNKEVLSVNPIFKNKPLAIQVGAFTDHRNAKTLTEKLSEFKAYIERIFVNNQYLYRVRIGPINDIGVAENIKDKLFKLGYTTSHLIVN
jgi:cell division septation protein DedD